MALRPPGSSPELACRKIPFHRQLADLGVKIADRRLMVSPGALDAIRKHLAETVHRLAFPRAHLVRMHFVLRRDLLDRPITAQRIQRYSGLEISRKPASFVHLCTPPLVGGIHLKPLSDFPGPPQSDRQSSYAVVIQLLKHLQQAVPPAL